MAWLFVGLGMLMIGTLLYMLQLTEDDKLAIFLTLTGSVYVIIGGMLTVVHDRHMTKRVRASRELADGH